MLAVKRLAEMQRNSEGRSSPRKRPPPITQQQEVMSVDGPPPDGELGNQSLALISGHGSLYLTLSPFRAHVSKDEHVPGQRAEH